MESPVMNALAGKCPMCGEGDAFTGPLAMKDRCDACGVVFTRDEGFWTGAVVLPYILASFWVVGLFTLVFATGQIRHPDLRLWVLGSTGLFVVVTYPPSKRLWLGLYGAWGYLWANEPTDEADAEPRAGATSAVAP